MISGKTLTMIFGKVAAVRYDENLNLICLEWHDGDIVFPNNDHTRSVEFVNADGSPWTCDD